MSAYLTLPGDAAAYGLPSSVTVVHIQRASAIIDSYLRRPEGMVYATDFAGAPAWMLAKAPLITLTAQAAFGPGVNLQVPVLPGYLTLDNIGQPLVIDRATPSLAEVAVITSITPPAPNSPTGTPCTITLGNVAKAHLSGALLDMGMSVIEERIMPPQRSVTRISRPNFVRLVSGQGRYGYGRRSDQMKGTFNEVNLLATLSSFGGPPQWLFWDPNQASYPLTNGEIWVPAGILLEYYTDVRFHYVAGFPATAIPDPIKQACATLAVNIATLPPELVNGILKSVKAGDRQLERFSSSTPGRGAGAQNTIIDQNSQALLDPFKARSHF